MTAEPIIHILQPPGLPTSPRLCGRNGGIGVLFAENITCNECRAKMMKLLKAVEEAE